MQSLSYSIDNTQIVVVNPNDDSVDVHVGALDGFTYINQSFAIDSKSTHIVDVQKGHRLSGIGKEKKGILVESSSSISAVAHCRMKWSNSAFQSLPISSLGNEYFIITYCEAAYLCSFVVLATDTSTLVTIDLGNNANYTFLYNGNSFSNGHTVTDTLDALEAIQIQAAGDLSGTNVRANKPIAVFSGNDRSKMMTTYVDPFSDQVPPVHSMGKEYIVANPGLRYPHFIKVLAIEDDTTVTIYNSNPLTPTYISLGNKGAVHIETLVDNTVHVISDKSIVLAHFVQDTKGNTAMYYPQSVCAFQTFYSTYGIGAVTDDSSTFVPYNNFVTIAVEEQYKTGVEVNGQQINPSSFSGLVTTPTTQWTTAVVPISDGYIEVRHTMNNTFGGFVFGYVNSESYAFTLGLHNIQVLVHSYIFSKSTRFYNVSISKEDSCMCFFYVRLDIRTVSSSRNFGGLLVQRLQLSRKIIRISSCCCCFLSLIARYFVI